jgi:hypothetical protein
MNIWRMVVQALAAVTLIAILITLLVMHPWQTNNNLPTNGTNATVIVERYDNPFVPNRRHHIGILQMKLQNATSFL